MNLLRTQDTSEFHDGLRVLGTRFKGLGLSFQAPRARVPYY